jgi:ABC-2 type transport system ATP-binding protein
VTVTVELDAVSKWYRDRVAVADVSFSLTSGVTGLLGHNGAGKTTALRIIAGFAAPSRGAVRIDGRDPRRDPSVYRLVGIVPDADGLWGFLTARQVVELAGKLRGVDDPTTAATRVLDRVGIAAAGDRRVGGFSKGMRQAVKLAQALVHDPPVLVLDEPLNGLDPARRRSVVRLVRELGAEGRTVVVSSHVLHEVERMAPRVVVFVNGRLVAEGATGEIRALLAEQPRVIRVESDAPRRLAEALVGDGVVDAVRLEQGVVIAETQDPTAFAYALAPIAKRQGVLLRRVESVGDDLESVYAYLQARARGAGS